MHDEGRGLRELFDLLLWEQMRAPVEGGGVWASRYQYADRIALIECVTLPPASILKRHGFMLHGAHA